MAKFWLVARYEYRRIVFRRGFLLGTLVVPLVYALLIAAVVIYSESKASDLPLGYVDLSGQLDAQIQTKLPDADDRIPILAYPDQASALADLQKGVLQAFFVFPADYPNSLQTDIYYLQNPPNSKAWGQLNDFVRLNLVQNLDEATRQRVLDGSEVIVIDLQSGRKFSESGIANIVLPVFASFLFYLVVMMSSSYMLMVVADEKENRTMEVMVTSLTPTQLIGGKVLGLLGTTLTQLVIYLVTLVLGVWIAAPFVPELQQLSMPWGYLGVILLFFLPSFVLIAAIMVAIGGSVDELQQGQQVAGLLNMLFILPIFLIALLLENPSHPLVLVMTFFPTTSFMTVSLRWGVGTIPVWQLVVSWVILAATMLAAIWAAVRIFRTGMLRYGQPLTLKTLMAAVKGE